MSAVELKGAVGELKFTVQVTRADTGKVEEYEMTGFVNQEQFEQLQAQGLIQGETNG